MNQPPFPSRDLTYPFTTYPQVQNKKLSERLRERNRHREQLEMEVEKLERMQEEHFK